MAGRVGAKEKGMSLQSFAARRALLPLAGLAALTGCGEAEKAFDDGSKTQFVDSFTKTCQSSETQGGGPADVAERVRTGGAAVRKEGVHTRAPRGAPSPIQKQQ